MTLPESPHFKLTEIGDGVYAAIAIEGSPTFSNAGIIDLGEYTLIFDTFNSIPAAEDLRIAAEKLTGRTASFVALSHAHSDHWMGNQLFADHATIIATPKIRQSLSEWTDYLKELKRDPSEYEEYIDETEKRLAKTTDSRLRSHLSWSLVTMRHEIENAPNIKLNLPTQLFEKQLVFHCAKRTIKLYTPGSGHTASDVILRFEGEPIAFIGDIGFFRTHPYMGNSDPNQWIAILEELADSNITTFVPGHGPIGIKTDIIALKDYIQALQRITAEVINSGGTEDDAAAQPVPTYSDSWAGYGRFERSMRFLYQQQKTQIS